MVHITSGCSVSYRYFDYGREAGDWRITLALRPLQEGRAVVLVGGEEKTEIFFAPAGTENEAALTLAEGVLTGLSGKAELEIRFASEREGELASSVLDRTAVRRKLRMRLPAAFRYR